MNITSWLKKRLPPSAKNFVASLMRLPGQSLLPIFAKSRWTASLYYLMVSRDFGREHQAVLAGRLAYRQSLIETKQSSVLLRRNTHRLEKGLIMRPRRDVFAEDYIGQTVRVYQKALSYADWNAEEKKWCTDVLKEYFSVVKDTHKIANARAIFESTLKADSDKTDKPYIPCSFDSLPASNVDFDSLHQLFLKRRSVRWYQDKPVPRELLEKAVNLATLAPSACNRQPYAFYISSHQDQAVQMAKCAGGTPGWAENIPCVIAVIGDLSAYPFERDRHVIYIDASLAAMQLMLALETLGLSTCAINWPDVDWSEQKMRQLLGLEDYQRPVMLLSVGYALDQGGIPYSQKKSTDILIRTF